MKKKNSNANLVSLIEIYLIKDNIIDLKAFEYSEETTNNLKKYLRKTLRLTEEAIRNIEIELKNIQEKDSFNDVSENNQQGFYAKYGLYFKTKNLVDQSGKKIY